jgi:hypothetical protein
MGQLLYRTLPSASLHPALVLVPLVPLVPLVLVPLAPLVPVVVPLEGLNAPGVPALGRTRTWFVLT